jgi:hypothetical protein
MGTSLRTTPPGGAATATVSTERGPAVGPSGDLCALADPGILARMIAPEPNLQDAPRFGSRAATGSATAVLGAVLVGGAGVRLGAAAGFQQRSVMPFGTQGTWVWLGLVATALLAAVAAARWGRGRAAASTARGLVVGLLVAVAGLLASLGAPWAYGAWLPLAVALGVALVLAVDPGMASLLALGCGAALSCGLPGFGAGDGVVAAACLTVAGVLTGARVAASPSSLPPAWSWRGRVGCGFAVLGCGWAGFSANATPAVTMWVQGLGLLAVAAVLQQRLLTTAGFAVAANLLAWLWPSPLPDATHVRIVAANGPAAVHYRRADQELQLVVGGEVVDWVGPDRHEAFLLATLAHALARPGDRAIAFGVGTGVAIRELQATGRLVLDVVDDLSVAAAVCGHFDAVGPVGSDVPARPLSRRRGALGDVLPNLTAGARQLVLLPVPVRAGAAALAPDVQRGLRELVADGLVLQVLTLDRTEAGTVHQCLVAAAAAHAHHAVFVVGDAVVLCSSVRPIDWERVAPVATWPAPARWLAHRAHVGSVADLQLATLGTFAGDKQVPAPADEHACGRAAVVAVLHAWLQPGPEAAAATDSVLRRWSALQAELHAANAKIRACAADAGGRDVALQQVARFLHLGAPTPELQAARGLAGADGITLATPATAARAAFALSPTFFLELPAVCRDLPRPRSLAGDLEDLARLPTAARLGELCREATPLAVALRARFPSACARALVEALVAAPLDDESARALRELADPFVLAEASRVLAPARRERELLAIWRGDLPVPPSLVRLTTGALDDRVVLAKALRGRRDPSIAPVLAVLLEDDVAEVRRHAAEALLHAFGDRVAYDPDWPQSQRHEAAERLRSLHNRTP